MLKIGIIGLGEIAGKAYLPVLTSQPDLELHLLSRSDSALQTAGNKYRVNNLHHSLDSLIHSDIRAAFVHTATEAHFGIVEALLLHGIHVFVDKPITLEHSSSKLLIELAESKGLILMTGFNRRYAPVYRSLREIREPNMVLMQKNRQALPGELRSFIFDDFIHVVDTLRFLFPYPVDQILVNGMKKDKLLYQVTLQFLSDNGATAIGIMNRDAGATEERVEVFSTAEKRSVYNVSESFIHHGTKTSRTASGDWEPMLFRRGFEQMVQDFLEAAESGSTPEISGRDALLTHQMCEFIVQKLEAQG